MQQRYYDPIAGRFLSVDPVTTDADTGYAFNRYAYANNNPYRYTDPDGRDAWYKEPSASSVTQLATVTIVAQRITAPAAPSISLTASTTAMRGAVGLGLLTYSKPLGAPSEMCGVMACGLSYAKPPKQSGLGEQRPDNAPPGTLGLDEAGRKLGWDKDKTHGVKNGATGGMAGGRTWIGVAPDGTVGINEGGSWSPQGHYDGL